MEVSSQLNKSYSKLILGSQHISGFTYHLCFLKCWFLKVVYKYLFKKFVSEAVQLAVLTLPQ